MSDVKRHAGKRWTIATAALYALAALFVAFASASHPLASDRAGVTTHDVTSTIAGQCHDQDGGAKGRLKTCCDACSISFAPGLPAPGGARLLYSLEIATRLDFIHRLGGDLNAAPDDTRSRAPPVLV